MPHRLLIVVLAGITTAAAAALESQERGERLTIAYRPMKIDSSATLQGVTTPGLASVTVQVDASGRTVGGSVRIDAAEDSALGAFAAEIAGQLVWDSASAARVAGLEVTVPFQFLVSVAGEPALLSIGSPAQHATPTPVAYLVLRADSTGPAIAEAVVALPKRLSGPAPWYPYQLQDEQIDGAVMIEAIVDTAGRVEQGSVKVMSSSNHGFDNSARYTVERSVFQVTRTPWRALRVRLHIPITYEIRH